MDGGNRFNGLSPCAQWMENRGHSPNRSKQVLVHFGTIPFSPSLQSVLIFGPNITDLCTKHPRSLDQTSLMNLPQEQSLVKEAWGSRLINQPIRTLISAAPPSPQKLISHQNSKSNVTNTHTEWGPSPPNLCRSHFVLPTVSLLLVIGLKRSYPWSKTKTPLV